MTKLDVNLSKKSENDCQKGPEMENLQSVQDIGGIHGDTPTGANKSAPMILMGEMDLAGKKDSNAGCNMVGPAGVRSWESFNWISLRRIAISQMILSTIACLAIVATMLTTGGSGHKFPQFMMAIYLLITGQSGLRASAKSYKHLIFYTIMSSLQWMINMAVLACLTFAIYEAPYYAQAMRYTMRAIEYEDYGTGITILITEIVASSALIGTIITGLLGLTACCKGFGVLIGNFEKILLANRNAMETA